MTKEMEHAFAQAKAQFVNIQDMIQRLEIAEEQAQEGPDETGAVISQIQETPLSVLVRDGWKQPGGQSEGAEEYEILLCTGGPAVRIYGSLDSYGQPDTAEMQAQDWFTSWATWRDGPDNDQEILLAFARQFYFGEG